MILEIVTVASMLAPSIQTPDYDYTPPPEPEVIYVTRTHAADACHEDEVWAPVHYETPGAIEDVHGVSRMCINVEQYVMNQIEPLLKGGTLIWEWDLPDEYLPDEYKEGVNDE